MPWQAWFTLAVVVATLVSLARYVFSPAMTMLGATVTLLVAGVISQAQAYSGSSNPAPVTVAALYVLVRVVEKTGALQPVVRATTGGGGNHRLSLARLLFPTAAASSGQNARGIRVPRTLSSRGGISPGRVPRRSYRAA